MVTKAVTEAIQKSAKKAAKKFVAKKASPAPNPDVDFPNPIDIAKGTKLEGDFRYVRLFKSMRDHTSCPEMETIAVQKAMSTTDDGAGGYLIPPQQSSVIYDYLDRKAVIRQTGLTVLPMPTGRFPISGASGAITTYYEGENQTITPDTPGVVQTVLDARSLYALIGISNTQLEDGSPQTERFVRNVIEKSIATAETVQCIRGIGGLGLTGLIEMAGSINIVSAGPQITQPTKTTLTVEDIQALLTQVEEAESEVTLLLCTPALYAACRLIKDNENRPILTNALNASGKMQRHLLDIPVLVTNAAKNAAGTTHYMIGCNWEEEIILGDRKSVV